MVIRMLGVGAVALVLVAGCQRREAAKADPPPVAKPAPEVARTFATAYRSDTVELPLSVGGEGAETEYFVRMKAGDVLVYSWRAEGGAAEGDFYSDFHGATAPTPPMTVVNYRQATGTAAAGSLTAPFAGVHGWLFKNDSPKPVKVKLSLAGFYELPSVRESMGLDGPEYVPFGPPGWPDRFGPTQKR
jgi:hypothetical protein